VATAREELHRLADVLPAQAVEELAEVGRVLERQAGAGEIEEVTDPEEAEIVRQALDDTASERDLAPEEAKAYLDQRRGA